MTKLESSVFAAALAGLVAMSPCGCGGGSGTRGTGGTAGGKAGTSGGGHAGGGNAGGGAGAAGGGGSAGAAGSAGGGGSAGAAGSAGGGGAAGGAGQGGAGGLSADAGSPDGGNGCSYGVAESQATADDLSLFGTPVYFNQGQPVPAGTYAVTYVDGCMKYGGGQGWTVNAYADGSAGWWLVGATTSDKIKVLPGTIGYAVGAGAFDQFEDCVSASKLAAPVMFTHAGGKLGVWLQDAPYSDNTAGVNDRNPVWRLQRVDCTDGGVADAGQ